MGGDVGGGVMTMCADVCAAAIDDIIVLLYCCLVCVAMVTVCQSVLCRPGHSKVLFIVA